ncbi:4-hydroxybutyrate CoA-transferase [Rhodococcus jostii]|uniref:4-hydroxybutyrate CoA-transferase n=1 Tax=Rhodococcus jostii TaxID=132919 RepID=A0A1H5M0C9_RHOJO|nr:4-hydroxybutyrate CoA-transferase [Rhodococcus jostii]
MRTVLCAEGPVEPQAALERYFELHPPTTLDPVHLVFGMRRSAPSLPHPVGPECFTVGSYMPGRGLKHVQPLTYHRQSYSEICRSLADRSFQPDVLITCVTPPDDDGQRSLGGVNGYLDPVVALAPRIFAEEVSWLPRIRGATVVTDVDDVVTSRTSDSDEQPPFSAAFDAVDEAVARQVARLIPTAPRLALGIGRVNDALALQLAGRGDVEILTGVLTEAVRKMYESGAIGGATMRAMSVIGSPSLLRWAASCDDVRLLPSTKIHNPAWLSQHDRFVAVLGAIDLDCAGNINSERAGDSTISGRGGAVDFARGAHGSPGGLSIVALRSSDRNGVSRLVQHVSDPSINSDVIDAVVTEKGSAIITHLDTDERRRALSTIF